MRKVGKNSIFTFLKTKFLKKMPFKLGANFVNHCHLLVKIHLIAIEFKIFHWQMGKQHPITIADYSGLNIDCHPLRGIFNKNCINCCLRGGFTL